MSKDLVNQYLICKQRGHEEDYDAPSRLMPSGEYAHQCKHCRCYFWEETVMHEIDVPKPKPLKKKEVAK